MFDIDVQRFLQVVQTKGVMSDEDVVREVVAIFGDNTTKRQIQMINRRLEPFNMTIKSTNCELTGKNYWVFTANVIDKVMTYPGQFTDVQLEFIRKVFSEIISSEEGYASTMTCINVRSQMTGKFSPTEAEQMLYEMVEQMWLHHQDGKVYIGVRSIGELMPYFKDSYADGLNVCSMCKDTLFHGYRCEECQTAVHLYCLAKAFKYQKNLKCLGCETPVQVKNLPEIEDDSMEVEEDDVGPIQPQKARKSHKRRG
ncbi:non-structural maintenance of chromosomes element 1 homolog [Diachasma alloeum]|uniref:non-structural maintenance of chromosomes element 1 homolog n=1 Tax=Diachasma alloeum TaxID=454923 RepID=UPI0007384CCA|nr:non-structural maintenance of chromosomes element 1 homolog [Diachasma alloeum]